MAFHVGQKVRCVDASIPPNIMGLPHGLICGQEYLVSAVGLTSAIDPDQLPCILIKEGKGHPVWAHRFRPAIERKTDTGMAILRKLLVGGKVDEKV